MENVNDKSLANQALVFMTTGIDIRKPFKLPHAYFLLKSLKADNRKRLVG
jgi:hypothetical protein